VTGSADHTVRLWDLDAASVMASFTTDDVVTACAIAHDGRAIVAGDASGAVHFLRVEGA
jgi:WD40 repeat protein